MLRAAHQVVPFHRLVLQQEAPVRRSTLGFQARPVGIGQPQRGTVVDRRQATAQQALALERQFLGGLVAGIEAPRPLQPLDRRRVAVQPVGLPGEAVPFKAQPAQVALDPGGVVGRRPLQVGIVETQQETASWLRANSQLTSARRMFPTWSWPVGLGAKRTATLMDPFGLPEHGAARIAHRGPVRNGGNPVLPAYSTSTLSFILGWMPQNT